MKQGLSAAQNQLLPLQLTIYKNTIKVKIQILFKMQMAGSLHRSEKDTF